MLVFLILMTSCSFIPKSGDTPHSDALSAGFESGQNESLNQDRPHDDRIEGSGDINILLTYPPGWTVSNAEGDGLSSKGKSRFVDPETVCIELVLEGSQESFFGDVTVSESSSGQGQLSGIPAGTYPRDSWTIYLLNSHGQRIGRGCCRESLMVSSDEVASIEVSCIPLNCEEFPIDNTQEMDIYAETGFLLRKFPEFLENDISFTFEVITGLVNLYIYDADGDLQLFLPELAGTEERVLEGAVFSSGYFAVYGSGQFRISVYDRGISAPQGFGVSFNSFDTHINLRWKSSSDTGTPGSVGYNVYRRVHDMAEWILLTDEPLLENRYCDTTAAAGTSYQYAVSRLIDGQESQKTLPRTGSVAAESTWMEDSIIDGQEFWYKADLGPGEYTFSWDDSGDGSGLYSANIRAAIFERDRETVLMPRTDKGFTSPFHFSVETTEAEHKRIWILIQGYSAYSDGSYGLKLHSFLENIPIIRGTSSAVIDLY